MTVYARAAWLMLGWLAAGTLAAGEPPAKQAKDQHGDALPPGALARLGTVRFRTGSNVRALAYSPDGKTLATLAGESKLRLWDAATGRELRALSIPNAGYQGLHFRPDGKSIALPTGEPQLRLWDLETGKSSRMPHDRQFDFAVVSLDFSRDGKYVAAVGGDPNVRIWEFAKPNAMRQLLWKRASPEPNGGPEDPTGVQRTVKGIVDRLFGAAKTEPDHNFQSQGVAFSPDSKILAAWGHSNEGQTRIRLWEAESGKQLHQIESPQNGQGRLVFSPDGKFLLLQGGDGSLLVWDADTGREAATISGTPGVAGAFAVSPDSKTVVLTSTAVRLFDLKTGAQQRQFELADQIQAVTFSPDGGSVAFGGANSVRIFDAATWQERGASGGHRGSVESLLLAADGKQLVSAGSDGTACVWNVADSRELRRFSLVDAKQPFAVGLCALFSPDGKLLVTFGPNGNPLTGEATGGVVRSWDVATGKPLQSLPADAGITSLDISPRGRGVATAWQDGSVRLWDAVSGKQLREFPVLAVPAMEHEAGDIPAATSVVFSPDGKLLAVQVPPLPADENVDADAQPSAETIHIFEVASGKQRRQFQLDTEPGNDFIPDLSGGLMSGSSVLLSFSPDGKLLAIGAGTTILLLDAIRGQEVRRLGGAKLNVRAVAFSPDGRRIAAGTLDGAVRIWDVQTGTVRRQFSGHRNTVSAVHFSTDGQRLVTGGADTTALVWDLSRLDLDAGAQPADGSPTAARLESAWSALADDEPDEAILALQSVPADAVDLFSRRLPPAVPRRDPRHLGKLIADLDDDRYFVRERAMAELEQLERLAEPEMRRVLESRLSPLEVRQRLDRLLGRLEFPASSPRHLQTSRAVEVLERIGSRDARALLERLSRGDPDAALTQDAKAALARLAQRR